MHCLKNTIAFFVSISGDRRMVGAVVGSFPTLRPREGGAPSFDGKIISKSRLAIKKGQKLTYHPPSKLD